MKRAIRPQEGPALVGAGLRGYVSVPTMDNEKC